MRLEDRCKRAEERLAALQSNDVEKADASPDVHGR